MAARCGSRGGRERGWTAAWPGVEAEALDEARPGAADGVADGGFGRRGSVASRRRCGVRALRGERACARSAVGCSAERRRAEQRRRLGEEEGGQLLRVR